MNRERKRKIVYEVLILLGMLALLTLVTRIWPMLLLVILGILIAALRLLFLNSTKVEIIEPAVPPVMNVRLETEKDLIRRAYSLIERRISEEVISIHPSARWHWTNPNALFSLESDEPLYIILNNAGGFRKATVEVHNLIFTRLSYETVPPSHEVASSENKTQQRYINQDSTSDDIKHNSDNEISINYDYLAFEWVDTHLLELNDKCNEAIGKGQRTLLIGREDLPDVDSWKDICKQLINNDFINAVANSDGILVSLSQ